MLTEYLQGGTKLVDELQEKHQGHIRQMQDNFDASKIMMEKMYKDCGSSILQDAEHIKTKPVRELETQLRNNQQWLQKAIEEARRESN